jgi:hypothetical protein
MAEDAYESARRRINDALRRQQNSLDLSENELTALPPLIGQLTALQSLDLFRCRLAAAVCWPPWSFSTATRSFTHGPTSSTRPHDMIRISKSLV